jgi:Cd2+/Zn2+-exporting ATPase
MQNTQVRSKEQIQEATFVVEGLDCADCTKQLEEGIRTLEDVYETTLSFTTGKLHLRYRGNLEEVRKLVAAHGYRLKKSGESPVGEDITRVRVKYAVLAAVTLLLAIVTSFFHNGASGFFLLATVVGGGHLTFRRAYSSIRQRRMDINFLMTIAVTGALIIGEWWEAATVAFLFAASNALETYTAEKNRKSIRALMDAVPETAHVLRGETPQTVKVEEIKAGESILVRPGEAIPLDGVVISGTSYVYEAAVTGESLPASKEEGVQVFAGTLNGNGSLKIRVSGTAKDSTLAKIVRLVEEAQERRAPAQQFVDRFARVYTPVIIALAMAIALIGPLLGSGGWQPWLYRGLALLIVSCPCALVVSTPVSIAAALSNAARNGVLVKGGVYLEEMGAIRAFVFDKTGTLTRGNPAVTRNITFSEITAARLIQLAASLEAHSEHLLAAAVRNYAADEGIEPLPVDGFMSYPGKGVTGLVNGTQYLLGSVTYLAEQGFPVTELDELVQGGETVLALASEEGILGALFVSDTLRSESTAVIASLRELGIEKISMLTGDRLTAAQPLADHLGLDHIAAGLLPEQKEEAVRRLRQEFGRVAMVGDGVNDAPALASANVGIVMGAAGSPTALETADIALMGDELNKLPFLITLSRRTVAIIRQNIALALLIKGLAILLVFPGWLTLWLAILADMGASVLVTVNGMRLLTNKEKDNR